VDMLFCGYSFLVVAVLVSAGRLVSAGSTMILLVVLVSAGRLVFAVVPADSSSSIPADNVPAGSSSSIPADYVSAGKKQIKDCISFY
ncbi:hypothetical protein Tco_0330544, partial [Tanacetum coccineum]